MNKIVSKKQLYIYCFLVSFLIRLFFTFYTIGNNESMDISIYRDAGQLIGNGVNPYDFDDNVPLRDSLRNDNIAFNAYTSQNQAHWNYTANSNLPFATLVFGLIEVLFQNALSYRIIFAFFDSLLSVLVLAFVMDFWAISKAQIKSLIITKLYINRFFENSNLLLIFGMLLGAFNPILLLNGTVIPEHKGTGLFFILGAIYFSLNLRRKCYSIISAIFLGLSVAFIGLGVFVVPFCIYNIYKNRDFKFLLFYLLLAGIACVVWIFPFMPELYTMMQGRIETSSRAGLAIPLHSSFWVIFHKFFGENWILFKNCFMVLFATLSAFCFFKKRINIAILTASIIYFFVSIFLIEGSMDRTNIGLLIVILLAGYAGELKLTLYLMASYLVFGFVSLAGKHYMGLTQAFDGYFNLVFTIIFSVFLLRKTFVKKVIVN